MKASNVKAMREAVEYASRVLAKWRQDAPFSAWNEYGEAIDRCRAALTAPPRNCDVGTDFNDAITTLANKRNWHDGKWNSERYCILANWLLAPATEQKGECDGSK